LLNGVTPMSLSYFRTDRHMKLLNGVTPMKSLASSRRQVIRYRPLFSVKLSQALTLQTADELTSVLPLAPRVIGSHGQGLREKHIRTERCREKEREKRERSRSAAARLGWPTAGIITSDFVRCSPGSAVGPLTARPWRASDRREIKGRMYPLR
jgi:hypothetical protein